MVAFLLRRLVLGLVVVVLLSCASYCFFLWEDQRQTSGPTMLAAWWSWAKGLWGGSSLHQLAQPTFTRNYTGSVRMVDAVGHTAALLGLAIVFVVVLAVALGGLTAARRGTALDVALRTLSYAAWAVPAFLLALLIQLLVNTVGGARGLGPFPLAGWPGACPAGIGLDTGQIAGCAGIGHGVGYALNVLRYTTLPALTVAVGFVGLHARYLRSALLESLSAPYVTTARAKGLSERQVLLRHALRGSLATFVGALLSDFGAILGTSFAVDYIFQFNGLGTVFISAFPTGFGGIQPQLMTPVLVLAALFVVGSSVIGDAAVLWLDPRARGAR